MMRANLALNFERNGALTRLRILQQDPPLRVIRAFQNEASEAVVHLHNLSGGILGGDSLTLHVNVGAAAQAQITSTGATRVYQQRCGLPTASQTSVFHVGEGALLEYLPDSVILFANSRFAQSTRVHLALGAGLIWWETLAAGRIASREAFAFDTYSVDSAIYGADRPLALERYRLCPNTQSAKSPARFGSFSYSTTLYICRTGHDPSRWPELERNLTELADELSSEQVRWGVSTLILNGIVVRGLATHAYQVTDGLYRFWAKAKAEVWNRPAVLPRKLH